jgi:hypothetical protein
VSSLKQKINVKFYCFSAVDGYGDIKASSYNLLITLFLPAFLCDENIYPLIASFWHVLLAARRSKLGAALKLYC